MIRNVGGCNCRDCNNGRFPDRSWWKRIWKKEAESDLIFYDLDPDEGYTKWTINLKD
jgi:hypothetical protein